MNVVEYSIFVFFWFYLLNNSDIAKPYRDRFYPRFPSYVTYALKCSFCLTFWSSLIVYLLEQIFTSIALPWHYVFVAPVVNLFAFRLFNFLGMEVHGEK